MTNNQNSNKDAHGFDLEKRTTDFAKATTRLCVKLSQNSINNRLTGQTVGAAGSVGANYREANDALGKKDFVQRLKIARRECKECIHWLEIIVVANPDTEKEVSVLVSEAVELRNILSAIIRKCE